MPKKLNNNTAQKCTQCKKIVEKNKYHKCQNCQWQDVLFKRYLESK